MKHIIGCPCLFKAAWITDQTLKNIYIIQKCRACGYTKGQCGELLDALKEIGIIDIKPEQSYIDDFYKQLDQIPNSCKEVELNYHFEPGYQDVNFCKMCEFSSDFRNYHMESELQALRYLFTNPHITITKRHTFRMQICVVIEQAGRVKAYLFPIGEQIYRALKEVKRHTLPLLSYDREELLVLIMKENRKWIEAQHTNTVRTILCNVLQDILIPDEMCSAKRYDECLKKMRSLASYQGRIRGQNFRDTYLYDAVPCLFFESIELNPGADEEEMASSLAINQTNGKKLLTPAYHDKPTFSLDELMNRVDIGKGFLGHEEEEKKERYDVAPSKKDFVISENGYKKAEKKPAGVAPKEPETAGLNLVPDKGEKHAEPEDRETESVEQDNTKAQKEPLEIGGSGFLSEEGALIIDGMDVIDMQGEDFLPFCSLVSSEEWITVDYAKRKDAEGIFITLSSRRSTYFLDTAMVKPIVFEFLFHVWKRTIYTYSVYLVWRMFSMNGFGYIRPKGKLYSLSALYNAVSSTDLLQPMEKIMHEFGKAVDTVYGVTALYKVYVTRMEAVISSEETMRLYRHYVNVEYAFGTSYSSSIGEFLIRTTFLSCQFPAFDLAERRPEQTFMHYELSMDSTDSIIGAKYSGVTRCTVVQALSEPIFIRHNAKLVELEKHGFSLIVDGRNRHVVDEMDQILMSRYAHLLSESGCKMPVLRRYRI